MHLPTLLTLVVFALSCGCATAPRPPPANDAGSPPPVNDAGSTTPPASESPLVGGRAPFLAIGEIRGLQGGKLDFVLYRSGLFEHKGEALGVLHPDGRFLDFHDNLLVAMEPDGTITFEGVVITVAEDGTATDRTGVSAPLLRFDEAGRIVGSVKASQVQGVTPALRRTAMFAVLLPDFLNMLRSNRIR